MRSDHDARISVASYSLSFLRRSRRKPLDAAGFRVRPFGFGAVDAVLVWGYRAVSKRGARMAKRLGKPLWRAEDAFLRSCAPGWQEPPQGLIIDHSGALYYDAEAHSDLRAIMDEMANAGVKPAAEISALISFHIENGLSKYNQIARGAWAKAGYVLVIDQVKNDASIIRGGADAESFAKMLAAAKAEHPDDEIIIRTHPAGNGHFSNDNCDARTCLSAEPANIWDVIEGAKAVYAVTSQAGFEAIIAGKRPILFGAPFYAGWGLSDDRALTAPRGTLSIDALYQAMMCRYPIWLDAAGQKAELTDAMFALITKRNHAALTATPVHLKAMSAWKRPHLKRYFPHQSSAGRGLSWGEAQDADDWIVEDGFLRSTGLGAELVPPVSLIVDRSGIYYDPTRPSDLEALIKARAHLGKVETNRIEALIAKITAQGISKYNLEAAPAPTIPKGREVILVPGQVEDDRSILLGATGAVKDSEALLKAVRQAHPDAFIIYKPHPDVLKGLRKGVIETSNADLVYLGGSLEPLWPLINRVATITSLTGFEALLRGKAVSTYGMPFYAGWGLTEDFAPDTARRGQASLHALAYAALIDYPIYYDPIARAISTPEIIVDRLAMGKLTQPLWLRAATSLQQSYYRAKDAISAR